MIGADAQRADEVFVETPARLHFGLLDLRGSLGRRYGGIGAAAPEPTLLVSACAADALDVCGEDAERAADFARQFLDHHAASGIVGGARLRVHRTLPPHAGLGSGTQLALAVDLIAERIRALDFFRAGFLRPVRRAELDPRGDQSTGLESDGGKAVR